MPEDLDQARERLRPYVEAARGFSGWTFQYEPRRLGPPPEWDYMARARELLPGATSVIDLGTGGGERFAELLSGFRGLAVATEEWVVNAPVAARTLRAVGASVVHADSLRLPFRDACFDLVLDRHEALEPAEVARVLAPGGTVLTRQVWHYMEEAARYFPGWTDNGDHYRLYQEGFRDSGLEVIDAREDLALAAFGGLGEVAYALSLMPWYLPDFDPLGRDLEALLALDAGLSTPEGIVMSDGAYIIEARKPRA